MGERSPRRRVLIEDARRNGQHLRATWHPDKRQFVISTWSADVCTGATRVAVDDVADFTGLLVGGLADAASRTPASAEAAPSPPRGPAGLASLAGLVDRLRRFVRGAPPGGARPGPGTPSASVRRLPRRSA
ncbi:MAG: hypothetical protein JXA83_03130 [Acidimicrobiales bacterium]|nr:hypothetical protein [Acidimicrobiales bacterium]